MVTWWVIILFMYKCCPPSHVKCEWSYCLCTSAVLLHRAHGGWSCCLYIHMYKCCLGPIVGDRTVYIQILSFFADPVVGNHTYKCTYVQVLPFFTGAIACNHTVSKCTNAVILHRSHYGLPTDPCVGVTAWVWDLPRNITGHGGSLCYAVHHSGCQTCLPSTLGAHDEDGGGSSAVLEHR